MPGRHSRCKRQGQATVHMRGSMTGSVQTHHDDELEGDDEPEASLGPKGILQSAAPSSGYWLRISERQGRHTAIALQHDIHCYSATLCAGPWVAEDRQPVRVDVAEEWMRSRERDVQLSGAVSLGCRIPVPYLPQFMVAIKALVANVVHICHLPAAQFALSLLCMMAPKHQ